MGRAALTELGPVVTPDTLLRWYRKLVAAKYDGSKRRKPGRPPNQNGHREPRRQHGARQPELCWAAGYVDVGRGGSIEMLRRLPVPAFFDRGTSHMF